MFIDDRDCGETFVHGDQIYHWDDFGGFLHSYAGLPVVRDEPLTGRDDPSLFAWPLCGSEPYEYADDAGFAKGLDDLLALADESMIRALVVDGITVADAPAVLAANAHRLPALRSLYLGFTNAEYEISWINQGDITTILDAFPLLERLDLRGSDGLEFRPVRHDSLRILRFESGGLTPEVVRAVSGCELPALEHLELWLGVAEYGGGSTVNDLEGILLGTGLPALRRLGLRNSEIQDAMAEAVAAAPVVARLEALSLAMGPLTDIGAEALLSGQPLTHLRELDLHHHYLTEPMGERLRRALPGVEVDLSAPQDALRGFYVSVSE